MSPSAERTAKKLLRDAAWMIYFELTAAGEDEVKENPHLRSNQRLHGRIIRFLDRLEKKTERKKTA